MSETETGTDSTVGFVGVGNMGRRMAANLAKAGFSLVIRDTDADAQQRFIAAHGGEPATGPQSFARATVVVTMLPDGGAVREAMLGWEGGIAAALPSGAVVLDMSSADPVGTQALARDLAPLGIRVIDAPVSGGITRAESGTLSLMVGGLDDEAFARVSPVLETLGERIFRTGPLGSGHAMKALNNFLGASADTTAA
jgi:3-hydroxyisobutyrate dehydrogenase